MARPNSTKAPEFVRYLDRLINISPKTQNQIAQEVGYDKSNIITMLKQGTTRLPLERVPAMARALQQDPAEMLRLWMRDYMPEALVVIEDTLGMAMSKNERSWVANLRKLSPGGLPAWNNKLGEQIKKAIEKHSANEDHEELEAA